MHGREKPRAGGCLWKSRDSQQDEHPRKGQEMRACFHAGLLTVCSCRRYQQTPSSGLGIRDL